MRGIALASLVVLAQGCAVAHDVDDAGPGVDAFSAAADASDARAFVIDAFARLPDAFAPPMDAFVPRPDVTTPPADATTQPLDASGLTRSGYLVIEQDDFGGGPYIAAFFSSLTPADLMRGLFVPGCAIIEESGSCRVITCTTGSSTDLAGTVSARAGALFLSASTTTSTGGGPPTWDEYFASGGGSNVPPGQIVDLAATGAAVPAFAGRLSMPPASGATLPATISRSADYVVRWGASTADRVWVGINLASVAATSYIECEAPGAAGSITVSRTLLAHFAAGDSVVPYAANSNEAYTSAGSYLIRLMSWSYTQANPTTLAP